MAFRANDRVTGRARCERQGVSTIGSRPRLLMARSGRMASPWIKHTECAAQMMRVGLYRPVHVKTLRSQKLRMLLTHRKLLQSKAIAIENDLRGTLRNFGLKAGIVGKVKFEARIQELVENLPDLAVLVEPLLIRRRPPPAQNLILHRRLLAIARKD